MTPAVFETTKVDFDLGRFVFRATGSRMLFDGYHVLYHEAHEPEEGKTLEDLPPIPPLVEGDVVTVKQITPNQHFTEPPPRYSEASLVKRSEEHTSELQSHSDLVCRLLLEKKKKKKTRKKNTDNKSQPTR